MHSEYTYVCPQSYIVRISVNFLSNSLSIFWIIIIHLKNEKGVKFPHEYEILGRTKKKWNGVIQIVNIKNIYGIQSPMISLTKLFSFRN